MIVTARMSDDRCLVNLHYSINRHDLNSNHNLERFGASCWLHVMN